jgi:DNA-binding SARP family transcriptional activator
VLDRPVVDHPAAGSLTFRLLGPFEVLRDGDPLELGGPQQRAVLAHLVLEAGRVVPVDRLIARVWGDEPPAAALGTLQSYISRLRRALEPARAAGAPARVLASEAPGYLLRVERDTIDLFRFESLADEGRRAAEAGDTATALDRFDEALTLWRGPALAGLAGEISVEAVIVRLEEGRTAVVEDRFDAELALGRHGAVIGRLQEAVAEQPLRERLWGQLALAQYRAGRQADAVRTLATARTTLGEELGLDPGPDLQRLELQILNHDPALAVVPVATERPVPTPPPTPAAAPPPPPAPSDVIGREREQQEIVAALDTVAAGNAVVLLVDGEAGIGKTTILDDVGRETQVRGWPLAWGRCVEGGMAPALWPWVEAVRSLARAAPPEQRAAFVGDAADVDALLAVEAGTSFQLADQLAAALARASAVTPVVVVLDDLHWADPESLELLSLVGARLAGTPVLLAGAHRPLDLGDLGPLATTLGALARLPSVRRLSLGGLAPDDVAAMMQAVAGATPDDAAAARMHERTGGNPFYIGELTRLLVSERQAPAGTAVPTAVRDVVRQRLARLPDRSLEVLAVAAVLGPDIDLRLLTAATGLAADRCLDDLDPAVVTRILVPSEGGRFRFGHALVRDAVLADLSPLRLARLHQRAADAITAVYGTGRDHAEPIAAHRWAASSVDDPGAVVDAQLRAAAVARGRAAMTAAAELVERAFEAAKAMPAGHERERREVSAVETMFTIERSWLVLGRGELAGRSEAAARRLTGPVGHQLLLYLQFGLPTDEGVIDDAAPLVREALEVAAAHPDNARSRLYAHYMAGANHWAAGRIAPASEHLRRSREAWEEIAPYAADRQTWATAVSLPMNVAGVAAITAALAGDDALRDELVARLDELAGILQTPASSISAGLFGAMAAVVHGDAAAAHRWALRATTASAQIRLGHLSPAAAIIEAWSRPGADPNAAMADAAAAMDEIDAGPTRIAATMLRSLAAEVRWRAGDRGGATKELERTRADVEARGERFWLPEVLRLQADLAAAEGASAEVAALLDEAMAVAEAQGEPPLAARARAARERLAS